MSRSGKRLLIISCLYLLCAGIGTALAVVEHLPAECGGILQGDDIVNDFVSGVGTALSPPLILLVIQVLFMILLFRNDPLKRVGASGQMVLGVLYFFGQVGEPILWRNLTPSGFHPEQALIIAANLLLPLMLFFAGARVLRRLVRPEGISPH